MFKKHLLERRYDVDLYPTQWVNEEEQTLTVPLYNFAGQLKGYQHYIKDADKHDKDPRKARYFTRVSKNTIQPMWGIERPLVGRVVFLTESVFKSSALHMCGLNSWSILGSDVSKELKNQLYLVARAQGLYYVCCGDDDSAGLHFSRTFDGVMGGFTSQDLDELSRENILEITSKYLAKGK